MTGIDDLILQALVSHISAKTQTGITGNSKAGLVRQGPLQDDPETIENGISILVYVNDPNDPSGWRHIRDRIQEIGTGQNQYWVRRYSVQALCQFTRTGYTDTQAQAIASEVMGRLQKALVGIRDALQGITDDFGETVYAPCNGVAWVRVTKAGGPPNEYVWETFYGLEVKTYQNTS